MYCLAKKYDFYVYGPTEEVEVFLIPNEDLVWNLTFYEDKDTL